MALWPPSFINFDKSSLSVVPDQGVHSK